MADKVEKYLGNLELRERFATILPRIEDHARIYFRHVRCPHRKADYIAETVAHAWKWFCQLAERGKDATRFPSTLATFAAKAANSGRRVAGKARAKCVMDEKNQRRQGFTVEYLPQTTRTAHESLYGAPSGQRRHDAWEERLQDNTITPPPEQAAFRVDFPVWLDRHSDRDRRMLLDMTTGERTQVLAERYGLSQPRISQMRREAREDWEEFTADPAAA